MADDTPDMVADIKAAYARLAEAGYRDTTPLRPPYESPDEPRDVKMAAQLRSTFAPTAEWSQPRPGTPEHAMAMLTGVPIEDIARQVNLQWLSGVTELIQTSQEHDPRFGTPADWTIVCSDHLFEHWTEIERIQIQHQPLLPSWSVYLVRSTTWWTEQIKNEPLRFAPPVREGVVIPFPVLPKEAP